MNLQFRSPKRTKFATTVPTSLRVPRHLPDQIEWQVSAAETALPDITHSDDIGTVGTLLSLFADPGLVRAHCPTDLSSSVGRPPLPF